MQPQNKKNLNASMTVEAAIAVPLFIFCMINLLFGIQVVETSSRITAALHETGNEICSYGYAIQSGGLDGIPGDVASLIYASSSVAKKLGSTTAKKGGIKGGIAGISYVGSSVMDGDSYVRLNVRYSLKYPVNMSIRSFQLGTVYYGHAWTGYDGMGSGEKTAEEDPIVYVTPSGTVYHVDIHCSHLNPSLQPADVSSINNYRNRDGSKYYPCEVCGSGGKTGTVFITDYGNRYHCDSKCPGIKREVYAIHLSEVGGRRACMTCGG